MITKLMSGRNSLILFFVSSLLFGNVWSLFEYICEEENLFKPYVHVYEHRRGKRIYEGGPGFHEIAKKQNVYVCINGPAYMYYSRTTQLGQVYEAPQSGVFAHTCEMHNVVPHMNATKVEYVLHLMAVVIYGDKEDYRKPGLQEFTAPYHFNDSEYGTGFPEHYQNATSVVVIGDATCTLEKGDDPLILINFTPVWPPSPPPPPPPTVPDPDAIETVERDNYVCKHGFTELKNNSALKPAPPPPVPSPVKPDDPEPIPTVTVPVAFPNEQDQMKVMINDEAIRPQGCGKDIYDSADYTRKTDLVTEKMNALHEKMKSGPDLATILDKFGEKIFATRKALQLQIESLEAKKSKAKAGSTQEKQLKAKIEATESLITSERGKFYTYAVKFEIAKKVLGGLGLVDATGKVADTIKIPPDMLDEAAVDWTKLQTDADDAATKLNTAKTDLMHAEAEILKDLLDIKRKRFEVWKATEDPTTGVLVATKLIEDAIAQWKMEVSQAEVLYQTLIDDLNGYRQGPLVYPDSLDTETKKKKKMRLQYTERTMPQRFYILGDGATAPVKGRRKRDVRNEENVFLENLGINQDSEIIRREKRHVRKVKPLRSIGISYDNDDSDAEYVEDDEDSSDEYKEGLLYGEDDFDGGNDMLRPKRGQLREDEDAEENEVISSLTKLQMNELELELEETKKEKRQQPATNLPKCEMLPKRTGPEGECAKGKPNATEACLLLSYTTGHQEAFPENSGSTDVWKKEVLDILVAIFNSACPNFYHRQVFLKRVIGAFGFYLTSDAHFNALPRPGVSKACDAFEAWQTNPLNPIVAERLAADPTKFKEKRKMWDELIEVLKKCRDAKRSLSFTSDIVQNTVRWRFVRPRDREMIEIVPYQEQAERENVFNWVIDIVWRLFSTAHGICMVGYEDNNPLISSKFYHFFTEDFMTPLQETWVNPRDNLIFQWIFGEFYNGDAEEWMERCMEASYIFSNRESYRPLRGLYVNCKSEHNYFTNGQYKDSQGMYHGVNKAVK